MWCCCWPFDTRVLVGLPAAGHPLATLAYGQQIAHITQLEEQLLASEAEREVVQAYLARAQEYEQRLHDVEAALARERERARQRVQQLRASNADVGLIVAASRELAALPRDEAQARERWTREMYDNYERARPWADCRATARRLRVIPTARRKSAKTLTTPGATSWR